MAVGRRGETTPGMDARYVAVLIILIALFMILYILFVPPEQRRVLLEQEFDGSLNDSRLSDGEDLLAVSPGTVSPRKETVQEHDLGAVNVFVKTEPKVAQLASNLLVKRSLFARQAPALTFSVDDTDLKKMTLFFSVVGAPRGDLSIALNGNVFFSGALESGARVVEVPLSYVRPANRLEFKVSHPGLAFWAVNKYELAEVGMKTEFERINAQESRTFVLSDAEEKDVVSARLSYFQVCNAPLKKQTTNLKVYVNDQSIFSGLVRCVNTRQTMDVDEDVLVTGKNTVRFLLEEGDFSFNEITIETESREAAFPTYSFIIDEDHVKDLAAGKKLMLQMTFGDARMAKTARVFIGEKNFIMQTDASTFAKDVSSFVQEGTNFVRVVPSNTFDIVSLKLVVA